MSRPRPTPGTAGGDPRAGSKRPDPRAGIFETVLVCAGRIVERERHLDRLAGSLRYLHRRELPRDLGLQLDGRAAGTELGRMRVDVVAVDDEIEVAITSRPVEPAQVFPRWRLAVELVPLQIPGGLGCHKWCDRSFVAAAEATAAPDAVPLLLDGETVLECSRGNVFLVCGDRLVTPPLDGRILPGIARARVLELAASAGLRTSEEVVDLTALTAAQEAFLTGSIRGVEPVRALRGGTTWREGAVTSRLAVALRRSWGLDEPPPISLA